MPDTGGDPRTGCSIPESARLPGLLRRAERARSDRNDSFETGGGAGLDELPSRQPTPAYAKRRNRLQFNNLYATLQLTPASSRPYRVARGWVPPHKADVCRHDALVTHGTRSASVVGEAFSGPSPRRSARAVVPCGRDAFAAGEMAVGSPVPVYRVASERGSGRTIPSDDDEAALFTACLNG